jgi:hypothetical protein
MKIDNFYSIDSSNEGSTLLFSEQRIRNKGTEKEEEFLYTEPYYYNNVKSALKSFLFKSLEGSKDVEDCIKRIEIAEEKINKLNFNI